MRHRAISPATGRSRRAVAAHVCAAGVVLATLLAARGAVAQPDRSGFEPVDFDQTAEPAGPPEQLAFRPGPPPAGYHVEQRARGGLVVTGGLVLAAGYGPAFALAVFAARQPGCTSRYDDECAHVGYLEQGFIPVLGPLLVLPEACGSGGVAEGCAIVAADAAVQGLGLYLIARGLQKRPVFVRDHVALLPWSAGGHGGGLSAIGTF